jgi:hypothetical protein
MAEAKLPTGLVAEEPVAAAVVITAGNAPSPDHKVVLWVKK